MLLLFLVRVFQPLYILDVPVGFFRSTCRLIRIICGPLRAISRKNLKAHGNVFGAQF